MPTHLKNLPLLFSVLLIVVGCSGSSETASPNAHPVTVITTEAKDTPVSFIYVAQTQSSHLVNIQARVSGFLDKRVYTEGEIVDKGDTLFIMDKKPFEAQVEAAEAAVERQKAAHHTAKLNLDRVRPLANLNALSQKDLDDAIGDYETTGAAVAQAEAQLETALLNLSYCTIYSPIHGITGAAAQQEGSYLNVADSQLTTVSALDPIWVNFSLSENELQEYRDEVKNGTLIKPADNEYIVKVIQVNGEFFPETGRITFTQPYFNPQTGTFLIRVTLANPDNILRPNQYVRVQVDGAIRPNAILVPQKAVMQSAKGQYVWVVKDNKAEYRPVQVGDWKGDSWFIMEGLESGEQVVIEGGMGLTQGMEVKATKAKNSDS